MPIPTSDPTSNTRRTPRTALVLAQTFVFVFSLFAPMTAMAGDPTPEPTPEATPSTEPSATPEPSVEPTPTDPDRLRTYP